MKLTSKTSELDHCLKKKKKLLPAQRFSPAQILVFPYTSFYTPWCKSNCRVTENFSPKRQKEMGHGGECGSKAWSLFAWMEHFAPLHHKNKNQKQNNLLFVA